MKYLYQAGIIFLFTFLGGALARLIPFPIPAAIWCLLLLFLKVIRAEQIKECSGFMVALLPVLFVAPTVNLMEQEEALVGSLPAVIVIVLLSTTVTFLVSGRVTQAMRRG